MSVRRMTALPAIAALLLTVSACTTLVSGHGKPQTLDPASVAGLPAGDGPNGLRPDAAPPQLPVDGGTDGRIDRVAESALADLADFWSQDFQTAFHRTLQPVDRYVSWDSSVRTGDSEGPDFCGGPTTGIANAGFCRSHNEIGWDRGPLMAGLIRTHGDLAPLVVLAHEYGHVVQYQTGMRTGDAPMIVLEQQADCYAGVFMRHVAEGGSTHFTMNTTDGLGTVLAVLVGIRDSPDGDMFAGAEHGSAFERVTAFQTGFAQDASACADIDAADVDARRGNIPLNALTAGNGGQRPVDDHALDDVVDSLAAVFPLGRPPRIDTGDPTGGCGDDHATSPVTYCPDTGRIGVDLPALAAAAAPQQPGSGSTAPIVGDFTAFDMVASRYALAVQDSKDKSLTGDDAAIRTACLTGAWTGRVADDDAGAMRLAPGDLDEAVAELLSGGLIAADVDGRTVPSAFSRLDAFRHGFSGGTASCLRLYP